jgi:hypothetical protein
MRQPFGQLSCRSHRDVAAGLVVRRLGQRRGKRRRRGEVGQLRDALQTTHRRGRGEAGHDRQGRPGAVDERHEPLVVGRVEEVLGDREVRAGVLLPGDVLGVLDEIAAVRVPGREHRDGDAQRVIGGASGPLGALADPGDEIRRMRQHQPATVRHRVATQGEHPGHTEGEQLVDRRVERGQVGGLAGQVRVCGHPGLDEPADELLGAGLPTARGPVGDRDEVRAEPQHRAHRGDVAAQLPQAAGGEHLDRPGRRGHRGQGHRVRMPLAQTPGAMLGAQGAQLAVEVGHGARIVGVVEDRLVELVEPARAEPPLVGLVEPGCCGAPGGRDRCGHPAPSGRGGHAVAPCGRDSAPDRHGRRRTAGHGGSPLVASGHGRPGGGMHDRSHPSEDGAGRTSPGGLCDLV